MAVNFAWVPNTGSPIWIDDKWVPVPPPIGYSTTTVPYIIRIEKYSDGNTTIDVCVMSDGTVHVDPNAFELMMEKMGFERA